MPIYHCSMKPIARSSGRSAVASAAYRAAEKLTNERDGLTHDFTRKIGVDHVEIVLPEGVDADWARDRSALWNAAEFAEHRKDARVAREFEVALPHELSREQRIALARDFAQVLADRYGAAVDVAVHRPHPDSDVRNHHAHIMMTTRQVTQTGLGEKTAIERENKWLLSNSLPTSQMQLRDLRQGFEEISNRHLALAGLDLRIDHRSHIERGLEITPTEHAGVHATQMQRQGMQVSRARLDADAARANAALIREKPEQVLALITAEKSVFDRHDIARTLHRYIDDDVQTFLNAFAVVMASPALVELQPEMKDERNGIRLARYSTKEMISIEHAMAESASKMGVTQSHGANRHHVDMAISVQNEAIRASTRNGLSAHDLRAEITADERDRAPVPSGLSSEQQAAIRHITGPGQIAAVVGFAGAGKSTMLAAARNAWEAQGLRVHGAALSGKAAEGLEVSSGIASRTLASWDLGWQNGRTPLCGNDVFVIDEAGMVGSRQLARFVMAVEQAGAKLVLVGDHEQLQAIGAGAPFRAIAERIGFAELSEIRRQRNDWQRAASVLFATHRTAEGLAAYERHGDLHLHETDDAARAEIIRDYLADRTERPDGSRVAMAHRRADVRAINDGIRLELQARGELAMGEAPEGSLGAELTFQTNDGKRQFAPRDRVVFLENNRDLGVKNGMLGTVFSVEPDALQVKLDGTGAGGGHDRIVTVQTAKYQAIDHGYATTIHKNQGATVDRSFVLASSTMDRHLTYVAMTRHRDRVTLHAGSDTFADHRAGRLIAHGKAPYQNEAKNRDSYFVTIEKKSGERQTIWGVDLERAMAATSHEIGDRIGLEHKGSRTVQLPDGTMAERHSWTILGADALARAELTKRLSRDGSKETTLDYAGAFAERRGIFDRLAEQLGLSPELSRDPIRLQETSTLSPAAGDKGIAAALAPAPAPGLAPLAETPAPLVPAIREHARTVDDVARKKAAPAFERAWVDVRAMTSYVYADPDAVSNVLQSAILDQGVDGKRLARSVREQPEQFGALRGKTSMFGDNRDRKAAKTFGRALGNHIEFASATWVRRLDAERKSEQWQREQRDAVEVPGLTRRSGELLGEVDRIAVTARNSWIDQLRQTTEGQKALEEAKTVVEALQRRFGQTDHRRIADALTRDGTLKEKAETVLQVAKTVERVRLAELTRDQTLKQELRRSKTLGLGL